ncbi:MAG: DUF551 domain-containing protein [Oscillospiraceae bacterium]|nr:DUF551 domain-containing protein [Oscillospiraceae bacterium]
MKIDELIRDLKHTVLHLPWSEIRKGADEVVDRVAQALEAQQARIAELEAELADERYRHDRVQDFEVAEAQELAKLREERRWIPVGERLPDLVPCGAGTAYSEAVNILTSGRKVLTAIWNGSRFLCDADYWEAWGEKITHWTPVLLPLPEPPEVDD